MGRKRSQFLAAQLARYFPEAHSYLASEVEQVVKEVECGNKSRLHERCCLVFRMLEKHRTLAPYVAQGFPAFLPSVLAGVGSDNDEDGVTLRLALLLFTSGTLAETVTDSVRKHLLAHIVSVFAHNPRDARLAAKLLARTVHLSSDGEHLAAQLLGAEEFWRQLDSAFFGADSRGEPEVLAACLHVLRACFSVTPVGHCTALTSRLQQLCTLEEMQNDPLVRSEALQLLAVLSLSASDKASRRCVAACLSTFILPAQNSHCSKVHSEANDNVDTNSCFSGNNWTFDESLALAGDDTPIEALGAAFDSLQRDQFDTAARLEDLHLIARLIFPSQAPCGVAAALLVLLPGALKGVFAAASGVDENLSAFACAILASAIDGAQEFSSSLPSITRRGVLHQEQESNRNYKGFDPLKYQRCLVEEFFLLGGVVLLEDMLTDYSSGVVMAATRLMRSLLLFSEDAHSVILASRCVGNLTLALENIIQEADFATLPQHSDGEALQLLLMLDTLTLVGQNGARLVPESIIGCIGTIATEMRANTKILAASIRTLTLLAAAHPMVATLVLDYEYMSSVLAPSCKFDADVVNGNNSESTLSEVSAMYICGSFDIMAVIVSQKPSCVTFEWMEILLAASRRLRDWEDHAPAYAHAFWNLVLETVKVSEDGLGYLQEDESFVELLFSSMMRFCRLASQNKRKGLEVAVCDRNQTPVILPLLLCLAKRMPLAQLPSTQTEVCDLLEAVLLLAATRRNDVPPDLIVDTVLAVATDSRRLDRALDALTHTYLTLVPVLLKRAKSVLISGGAGLQDAVSASAPVDGEESVESPEHTPMGSDASHGVLLDENAAGEFLEVLTMLSGVLMRSEGICTQEVLASTTGLILEAIRSFNFSPLPFSYFTSLWLISILHLLRNLLRVDSAHVKGVTHGLLFDHHVLQLLSQLLRSFQGQEGNERVRGVVCDVVRLLYDIQKTSSLFNDSSNDVFYPFAGEHVLRHCNEPSPRLLFISLAECASFRHHMLGSHAEDYRVVLSLSQMMDGDAADVMTTSNSFSSEGEGTTTTGRPSADGQAC